MLTITNGHHENVILSQLLLPLEPESVRHARRFMAATLEAWFGAKAEQLIYEVQSVTSEVVTNAVVHAGNDLCDPEMICRIMVYRSKTDGLRVDVHDPSGKLPTVVNAGLDGESGHGLRYVRELLRERGGTLDWHRLPQGKCVQFTLPWQPY